MQQEDLREKIRLLEKELAETRHALRFVRGCSLSKKTFKLPGWKVHYAKNGKRD